MRIFTAAILHLSLLSALSLSTLCLAQDPATLTNWHQLRGPLANGVSPSGDPPTRWSDTENIRWKAEIPGVGSSTPIVFSDRIFLLTAIETDRKVDTIPDPKDQPMRSFGITFPNRIHQFAVVCLDRATGKPVWQKTAIEELPHEGHHPDNDFASATPITDGKSLFVSFGSRGVFCFDVDGNLKWKKDFGDLSTRNSFGEGSSPALFGDTLVTTWDHDGKSFIVAQSAATGDVLWQKDRDEKSAWATPLILTHGGRTQVITNASNFVRSYDLASGEILWQCGGQVSNVIPSPVANDKLVYCMSGYRGSALFALPLDATGDITGTERIAWKLERGTPYVPSPLLYDNRLYFLQSNDGILSIADAATGKVLVDRQRLPEIRRIYASPVGAAGRVYLTSRDGVTLVIRHGDTFEVLATNKLSDDIDASAAVVGKELYLRGKKHLYCIAEE